MSEILVAYFSATGTTKKLAEKIGEIEPMGKRTRQETAGGGLDEK